MVLKDWRCSECNKKLAECDIIKGTMQIKCPRCGIINEILTDKGKE